MSKVYFGTHRRMSWGQKLFCWLVAITTAPLAFTYFRFRFRGRSRVPGFDGVVLAANHPSYVDSWLLGLSLIGHRFTRFLAKVELFRYSRFLGWFITSLGAIAIDRSKGGDALKYAQEELEAGEAIFMFAEGSRSRKGGRMDKLRKGTIILAIRTDCPIVPVGISGSDKALPKGSKLPRPNQVKVTFGEPYLVRYEGSREERIPEEVITVEVERLTWRIASLLPKRLQPTLDDIQEWYGPTSDDPENIRHREHKARLESGEAVSATNPLIGGLHGHNGHGC